MAVQFKYEDLMKGNAQAPITPQAKVPTTAVSYSDYATNPTIALNPVQTPTVTPNAPATNPVGGAVVGTYGSYGVTPTSVQATPTAEQGTTISYSDGMATTPTVKQAFGGTKFTGDPQNVDGLKDENSTTGVIDPSTVTPEQYYKYMYETGLANAEKAKEQAMVQSQAQYNEYINPYGTIASQQAAQGLTNGGYSKYLQGQAYQGMIDTQNQARAGYNQTTQNLYSDYLGKMAEYNQAKIDKADSTAAAKANLLNDIGKYTSQEALGAALDALGITNEADRQTYIDAWTKQHEGSVSSTLDQLIAESDTLTEQQVRDWAKANNLNEDEAVKQWSDKTYAIGDRSSFDADKWQSFFDDERYETLTPEQKKTADEDYSSFIASNLGYDSKTGSTTSYFIGDDGVNNIADYQTARDKYEEAMADEHYSAELKEAIKKEFESKYTNGRTVEDFDLINKAREFTTDDNRIQFKDDAKIVDTNSNTFKTSDFGDFKDTGKAGSGQENLISAIVKAAKNGQIKDGECVLVNYGRNTDKNRGGHDIWMYVDGKFVQLGESYYGGGEKEGRLGELKFANIPGFTVDANYYVDGDKKVYSYTIRATKE